MTRPHPLQRRPVWALHVLIVGLALHNLVMALLWRAGLRGGALTVVAAWKDMLLLAALVLVVAARRSLPFKASSAADWLALAFGALVVLYGVLPQSWLGGGATHKGVLYGARHDLLPVGAYFLGRGLDLTDRERSRLCHTILAVAGVVAAYGLIDVYLVPLSFWRHASGWFSDQLGLTSRGLSGLPENFVYNAGNGVVFRRLTSTFLTPLATSYLLVVALFFIPFRRRFGPPLALLLFAALLWTHTRSALLALVVCLLLLAIVRRRVLPLALACTVAVVGFAFVQGYDHFAPRTHFTPLELKVQEQIAKQQPVSSNDATSANESSTREHLASLREGVHTVLHHPWGYGLGNAGVTAQRTHVKVKAGESTYTELGIETGLLGALVFVAWSLVLLRGLLRRRAWLGAAFAAVLVLGLQTDVIGVPWIAVAVWALAAGSISELPRREPEPAAD
jgi:O-Antigen ligase